MPRRVASSLRSFPLAYEGLSVPTSTAIPPAAAEQQDQENNYEKRGRIHVRLLWRCGPIRRAREMRVMELTLRSALRFHWTSPVARRRVQVERHYN